MSEFPDHFSEVAELYRAARPRYPAALAEWLAGRAPGRGLAWEAGCGSGQFTATLAEAFARVHATDASAEQIAQAPPHGRIHYATARAERSGLPDASADLICAAQAAHWFDLPAWYAEARRVARPGGVLALICYVRCSIAATLDPIVDDYHDRVVGPYWPLGRVQVEDDYRSLQFPFAELSPPDLHLEESWNLSQFLAYVRTWSGARRQLAAAGPAAGEAFRARLAEAWGDPATLRPVRWPLRLRATILG